MECSTAQEGQWIYFIELSQRYAELKKVQEKAEDFQKALNAKPEPVPVKPENKVPHRPLQHGAGRPSTNGTH